LPNSVSDKMGQYGAIQILSCIFLEYRAVLIIQHIHITLLRVPDAAGENKICKKIKESERIQDTRCLSQFFLLSPQCQG